MNPWLLVAALSYLTLALAHSYLGERDVLRPLFAQSWNIGLPRGLMEALLRWAWHLTSIAWLAAGATLAAAALGSAVPAVAIDWLGVAALVSAAVMFIGLRGVHAAWAIFALAALGCFVGAHGWPSGASVRLVAGGLAAAALAAISALHFYWLGGGKRGLAVAIPTRADGNPTFRPPALATLAVAVALLATAGIIASAAGLLPALPWAPWSTWLRDLGLAASAVFGLRMVGDFRFAGLFKREWRTEFARWDSQLYSPLCGALCIACAIAAAG